MIPAALVVVRSGYCLQWLGPKSYLDWVLDHLKKVTAFENRIVVGIVPSIWETFESEYGKCEFPTVKFPAANDDPFTYLTELRINYPETQRLVVASATVPLLSSSKYEELYAKTETCKFVQPGHSVKVAQTLPNGRVMQNGAMLCAPDVVAFGVGEAHEFVSVDLAMTLDVVTDSSRSIVSRLVE